MLSWRIWVHRPHPYCLIPLIKHLSSATENGTFFAGGGLFVSSASSVLMLVVVALCSDDEFSVGESDESVDVFPMVAKASLALAATSRERNFLYFILATWDVCF